MNIPDLSKIDMMEMMPMISNLLTKIDLEKLQKSGDIEKAIITYKKEKGKLRINLSFTPESDDFSDSFIEILKVVLTTNPKTEVIFKEV